MRQTLHTTIQILQKQLPFKRTPAIITVAKCCNQTNPVCSLTGNMITNPIHCVQIGWRLHGGGANTRFGSVMMVGDCAVACPLGFVCSDVCGAETAVSAVSAWIE